MQNEEYGYVCTDGEDGDRLYLAPHGPDAYQVISGPIGAAVFTKENALGIIDESEGDLYFVPVEIKPNTVRKVRDPDEWHQMNAPKSQDDHANNNFILSATHYFQNLK